MTGTDAGLDEAVDVGTMAMAAFDATDPRRTVPMAATAVALRRRSGYAGDAAELAEAIRLGQEVVRATPPGDPHTRAACPISRSR